DGDRLRGRAAVAGPPRGAEGPAGARPAQLPPPPAVPPRGPVRRPATPHQHRAGLRRGRGGGPALLRDAVHYRLAPARGHRRAQTPEGGQPTDRRGRREPSTYPEPPRDCPGSAHRFLHGDLRSEVVNFSSNVQVHATAFMGVTP